jgi:hypothetical protein
MCSSTCHVIMIIASDAPFVYSLIHLHHTGLQEETLVAVQEEQTGSDPQETQAQEVPEVDEQAPEHLSLLRYKSNSLYI